MVQKATTLITVPHVRLQLMSALLVACSLGGLQNADAQVNGKFEVLAGESTRVLAARLDFDRGNINAAQLAAIVMEESCKPTSVRLMERNRPALAVQNTSTTAVMTQFEIDIEELGFEFGDGDVPGDMFGGLLVMPSNLSDAGVMISAVYGTTGMIEDPTKLVVSFNNGGLAPGAAAIFRVDLDQVPIGSLLYPDFRGILLGADIGDGPSDPALVTGTFTDNGMTGVTNSVPFAGAVGQQVFYSGLMQNYNAQSETSLYELTVPEPSTALLLLSSCVGILARNRRRAQR